MLSAILYGEQEGAKKGYNPRKPGYPSHRPIFAFLAELKIVVNPWLRPGNVADLTGLDQFLKETLAKMPPRISPILFDESILFIFVFIELSTEDLIRYYFMSWFERIRRINLPVIYGAVNVVRRTRLHILPLKTL